MLLSLIPPFHCFCSFSSVSLALLCRRRVRLNLILELLLKEDNKYSSILGFRILIPGVRIPDPGIGIPVSGIVIPVPGMGIPVPSTGIPIPGIGIPIPCIGIPVPGIGIYIPGIKIPIPGIGTPVSGIGIRIPGIGIPIPGVCSCSRYRDSYSRYWDRYFKYCIVPEGLLIPVSHHSKFSVPVLRLVIPFLACDSHSRSRDFHIQPRDSYSSRYSGSSFRKSIPV